MGRDVRRLAEGQELKICMRLRGGDPEGDGREPLDERFIRDMAATKLIKQWAEDNNDKAFYS
eukprot:8884413-Prorocentrum_lima.AAC.1